MAVVALGLALCGGFARSARADDTVVVRGVYYREASTRVIQPMVDVERDSETGVDVSAHFLVDAITSASASTGTALDSVFTETRNEAGLNLRKRWARSELSAGYKYSAESDYWSHAIGISGAKRLWGDTGTLRLALGRSFDSVTSRGRIPNCAAAGATSCPLDTWFSGVSYTQVLSPVAIAQASYEVAYLNGFQGNPYRQVPSFGLEMLPDRRLRNAITARVGYFFPGTGTGVQLNYRCYWDVYPGQAGTPYDPWALRAHTIEGRIYQQIGPSLEIRLLYRQYIQNQAAAFWCDVVAQPSCYVAGSVYYSSDPKLGVFHTEYPEVKVIWQAEAFRPIAFLRWFAAGTFEISYGRYFQGTSFGDAHVLQTGYTMPY